MTHHAVDDPHAIVAILSSDALSPPQRPGAGATLELRASMARFSAAADHGPRRQVVDELLATLEVDDVARRARVASVDLLAFGCDPTDLARSVPVRALLAALGLVAIDDDDTATRVLADVDAVAEVIGRGREATVESDTATERLVHLAGGGGHHPVAAVSVLYQSLDAVAALITAILEARAPGWVGPRRAAVARTVRVVTDACSVDDLHLVPGDVVELAIGTAGLEYGAGRHACPGRELAEAIAAAVIDTIP